MPHQLIDSLLPGEALLPGESLISLDGRFHLYLEEDGQLVAFAYSPSRGIKRFWNAAVLAGADARLELDEIQHPRQRHLKTPAIVLKNRDGQRVWAGFSLSPTFRSTEWGNLFFTMQSDGNIVHYAKSLTHTGVVRSTWPSDTYQMWIQAVAVPPNTRVCDIHLPPGSIAISTTAGNADIINVSGSLAVAKAGTQVVGLLPQQSVSANIPGTVNITYDEYNFPNLRDSDGTMPRKGSDALTVQPARPGQRLKIEIGPTGLSVRDQFDDRFELKSLGALMTTTMNIADEAEADSSCVQN